MPFLRFTNDQHCPDCPNLKIQAGKLQRALAKYEKVKLLKIVLWRQCTTNTYSLN